MCPPLIWLLKMWGCISKMWVVLLQILMQISGIVSSLFSVLIFYDTYHYLTSYIVYLFLLVIVCSSSPTWMQFSWGQECLFFCILEWMAGPRMAFNKCLLNEWINRRNIYKHSYSWLTFLVNKMESYHGNSSAIFFSLWQHWASIWVLWPEMESESL